MAATPETVTVANGKVNFCLFNSIDANKGAFNKSVVRFVLLGVFVGCYLCRWREECPYIVETFKDF